MAVNTDRDTYSAIASETVLPLLEELAEVSVREVETGRVRVTTRPELYDELLTRDLVQVGYEIERVAIGREIETIPEVRTENGTIIVPVVAEVPVTTIRLMLVEEIRLHRTERREAFAETVSLRRQTAVIERLPGRDVAIDANLSKGE